MTLRPAYDEITLALGSWSVRLRPSLRAASHFAREDGFANLAQRLAEFHLGTIRELITVAAIDRQQATAFLDQIGRTPLKIVAETVGPQIAALVTGFAPAPDDDAKADHSGKPMPWPKVYRELYRKATGWLGWTPEAAWNATPTEIMEAVAGLFEKLKALHGTSDKEANDKQPDPEQAARNIAEGLDPEFDRAGLRALKAKIAGGKR
ncbi:hypothetical protein [Mesorhizobium sp. KR1-2]|uniref:hypothetical protein n=1 Tax=Mesorhizobium sp. KR1-2 TaxID=3156609 RepID=UPI0032B38D31